MIVKVKAPKITDICVVFPKNSSTIEQDLAHLSPIKIKIAKDNLGISRRYFTDKSTFASDLAIEALSNVLTCDKNIDALIVVSDTPDYLCPTLSTLIAHGLGLKEDLVCFDNIAFCNGFLSALFQAALLLEHYRKVAIVCVSVVSKSLDPKEKIMVASMSDASSVVLVERSNKAMYFIQKTYSNFVDKKTSQVSCYKKGGKFFATDNHLIFKEFSKNFPTLYNNFKSNTPEANLNIFHSVNAFFGKQLERECEIENFNQSLYDFSGTNINDIPLNLILAKNAKKLMKKGGGGRIMLASYGVGTTTNLINMPIWDFNDKIIYKG